MPGIEIVEVESASRLKQFILYPNDLYRDDPNYVTPLLSERKEFFDYEKNPFYRGATVKLFLAMKDGRPAGRIATCINHTHNDYHQENIGFFGFFDCPDNYEIASTLLKVAMITLKKAGVDKMRGPVNFSTNHESGFLVKGFDGPPAVMMPYNQPYLPQLAEKFGLKKAMDLIAYRLVSVDGVSERIAATVRKMQKRSGIVIRGLNMSRFDEEVLKINQLYNQAWEHNWGFVPMGNDEFVHTAANLKQIVDPRMVLLAEYEGEIVAFLMGLPDINQVLIRLRGRLFPTGLIKLLWHTKVRNKIDTVRVATMGVLPQYRKRGIDSMLYVEIFRRGVENGYLWGELSWVLETNELMRGAAEKMNAELYRRYRIVEMPL